MRRILLAAVLMAACSSARPALRTRMQAVEQRLSAIEAQVEDPQLDLEAMATEAQRRTVARAGLDVRELVSPDIAQLAVILEFADGLGSAEWTQASDLCVHGECSGLVWGLLLVAGQRHDFAAMARLTVPALRDVPAADRSYVLGKYGYVFFRLRDDHDAIRVGFAAALEDLRRNGTADERGVLAPLFANRGGR